MMTFSACKLMLFYSSLHHEFLFLNFLTNTSLVYMLRVMSMKMVKTSENSRNNDRKNWQKQSASPELWKSAKVFQNVENVYSENKVIPTLTVFCVMS